MAENKKSIIEEALLDAKRIQEALNSNTKEILRSIAREEIDGVVKESLNEDDYEEEDVDDTDLDLANADDDSIESDEVDDTSADITGDEEGETDIDGDYDDEAGMDNMEGGDELSYDGGEESGEDYELDMTGASDDDVIAVYKKLSGDDEIEVVSDNEVHIKDPVSGSEYHIKLGGGASTPATTGVEDDFTSSLDTDTGYEESEEEEDDVVFEIALDEEEEVSDNELTEDKVRTATSDVHMGNEKSAPNTGDIEGQKAQKDADSGDNLDGGFDDDGQNGTGDAHADHIMNEEETEEVVDENLAGTRGYAGRQGAKKGGDDHHPSRTDESMVQKYNTLLAEAKELKKQNDEFRGVIKNFRQMLGETVVFNTNLTYVTRLLTEHSTTKEEKAVIIKRFDDATTIKESKRLYKTIVDELSSKKPIQETLENKINREVTTSTSTQLNESTAYVDPSTKRIMDLIKRVEKR